MVKVTNEELKVIVQSYLRHIKGLRCDIQDIHKTDSGIEVYKEENE